MLHKVMLFFSNMKLHNKLLLSYVFITLLPVMIIAYFLVSKIAETAYTQTEDIYDINTVQIKTNLVFQLKSYISLTDNILKEKSLTDYIQHADTEEDEFRKITRYDGVYQDLSAKYPIGEGSLEKFAIFTTNSTIKNDKRFIILMDDLETYKPWVRQICNGKGESVFLDPDIRVGEDLYTKDSPRYIIIGKYLNPYFRYDYLNLAVYLIPETEIRKFFKDEGKNKKIYLLNSNDVIISSTEDKSVGQYAREIPGLAPALANTSENEHSKINTSENIIFCDRISSLDCLNNWKIITVISTETMKYNISSLVRYGVFICLISIIITIVFVLFFSRTLTKKVKQLAKNMARIREGQFDVFVDTTGKDEISELSASFKSMVERINNLIKEVYILDIKKKEAEINALQSQINPHFLFNTMESIRMNLWNKQDYETSEIIQKFAKLLRRSIEWGNDKITMQREIELVEIYLKIQQYRYKDKLSYEIDIDENLNNYYVPKFTIQPIVENAIGHGIEMKKGRGLLRVFSEVTEDYVKIIVQDDGVGMDEEQLEQLRNSIYGGNGDNVNARIGVRNVHQRIQLFYGDIYGIKVNSKKGEGTRVEIVLPPKGVE